MKPTPKEAKQNNKKKFWEEVGRVILHTCAKGLLTNTTSSYYIEDRAENTLQYKHVQSPGWMHSAVCPWWSDYLPSHLYTPIIPLFFWSVSFSHCLFMFFQVGHSFFSYVLMGPIAFSIKRISGSWGSGNHAGVMWRWWKGEELKGYNVCQQRMPHFLSHGV